MVRCALIEIDLWPRFVEIETCVPLRQRCPHCIFSRWPGNLGSHIRHQCGDGVNDLSLRREGHIVSLHCEIGGKCALSTGVSGVSGKGAAERESNGGGDS